MATWTSPKTDWVSTDTFNLEDYNRIKNNIEYLADIIQTYVGTFDYTDMGDDLTNYTGYWNVAVFNAFETNLENMNAASYMQDIGTTKAFYENGVFITYTELNRIESACQLIYDLYELQASSYRTYPFTMGALTEAVKP